MKVAVKAYAEIEAIRLALGPDGWLAAQKLALALPDCSGDDLAVVDGVTLRRKR